MRIRGLLVVCALAALAFTPTFAQVVSPSSHWGALMIPESRERTEIGLHFLGFTRYGKEVDPETGEYTFTPYNDMEETLGFNFLSLSHYDIINRRALSAASVSRRWTFTLGVIDDNITEFLQNDVVHWNNTRKDSLDRVPRTRSDTRTKTSIGPRHLWPPVLAFSNEYFVRVPYQRRREGGGTLRGLTPLFVGGGVSVGTLNQEAFLQAGTIMITRDVGDHRVPVLRVLQLRSVGVAGMARSGVLLPGHYFKDLTGSYFNAQAAVRADVEIAAFPIQLDLAATVAHGFFVASRTPAQWEIINELPEGTDPASVYSAKSPVTERFVSVKLRIGEFTLETYNDMFGGKDKGPSFGVHATYSIPPALLPWN
jgi:hypothetical protein